MPKEAVFTMKLESELRDAFMAAAEAADRPASQIVRELMRGFVDERKSKSDYLDFYRRKVELARKSIEADRGRSGEEVEAYFAARRAELLRKPNEDDG